MTNFKTASKQGTGHRDAGNHPRRRGPLTLLAMIAVVLFLAAGCAAIPTSGPVGKSDPVGPHNNSNRVDFSEYKPVKDASPESIIRGFIDNGTGTDNDFQTARQYLTPALAQSWAADKRTLVYRSTFSVVPGKTKGAYLVKFDVVSSVDSTGVLTPLPAGSTETLEMDLVQADGQWRIAKAPDGLVLSEDTFGGIFKPVSLYFYDPTYTYGVPDVRWLEGRSSGTATAIVRAMLAGPAPYLKGAVVSAFPTGMALSRDSVPVDAGLAKVGLSSQPLLKTSVHQRQQMQAQLLATLQNSLNDVSKVEFLADDREVDMGGAGDAVPSMVIDNAVSPIQVGLSKNALATFDGNTVTTVPGMAPIADLGPTHPAVSYDGKNFAFLSSDGNHVFAIAAGHQPVNLIGGVALTPPSFAPNGWLWAAAGDRSGVVIAVNAAPGAKDPVPVLITVPWLVGRQVTTLRISRDGTRMLIISNANGESQVSITGIVKSAQVPKELTTPDDLPHEGSPSLGTWIGDTSVAVLAPSPTSDAVVQVLNLAKAPTKLAPLKGITWLSAGSGEKNIYAQTATEMYTLVGSSWQPAVKGLVQASFAG